MFVKKIAIAAGAFCLTLVFLALHSGAAFAAPIEKQPVTLMQPDGSEIHVFVSGDEFYNWVMDDLGYTIVQDPSNGYYVYADLLNGQLLPTEFIVGVVDPLATPLRPYLNISAEAREAIRKEFLAQDDVLAAGIQSAPQTGTITNLVIFIRFAGEAEFTDATSAYTSMLNSTTAGANSLRNYFQEVSYNALTVNSSMFPVPGTTIISYQDAQPRGYYQPYDATLNPIGYTGGNSGSERRVREHTLLKNAVNHVGGLGQFPSGASVDADNDGYVDSLTFVVSGSPTGWSSLLWPHQWALYTYSVSINGKSVWEYSFHLQTSLDTGVLAHEMFHVLGSPDLYHYSYDGIQPVGQWDVMEQDLNPPQHMSCYMKYKYGGWISSLPVISTSGTYTLNPLTSSTNNCYKIPSPNSSAEFFIVEYRREVGSTFENSLPGTGLLVYRINSSYTGNAGGPPDEVYVYRPGGTTTLNGTVGQANFSSTVGRTAINDATDPRSFLTSGGGGGLNLCNIGASGTTISFDICGAGGVYISGNAGIAGATLSYTDGAAKTATSGADGSYSIMVASGWSGTITPAMIGYTFVPSSRTYSNIVANQPAQNYLAASNELLDPGFENYNYSAAPDKDPYWAESSTNFGTPLCSSECGTGAHSGSAWAWFGGVSASETGSLSQTVMFPVAQDLSLDFYLRAVSSGGDVADLFTAAIDNTVLFSLNATQVAPYSSYTLVSLDISEYADGAPHTIQFNSVTGGQVVSFHLDDVALTANGYATNTWAVELAPSADPDEVARQLAGQNLGQVGSLANHYLFSVSGSDKSPQPIADSLSINPNVLWFEQQISRRQNKRGGVAEVFVPEGVVLVEGLRPNPLTSEKADEDFEKTDASPVQVDPQTSAVLVEAASFTSIDQCDDLTVIPPVVDVKEEALQVQHAGQFVIQGERVEAADPVITSKLGNQQKRSLTRSETDFDLKRRAGSEVKLMMVLLGYGLAVTVFLALKRRMI